MEKLRIKIARSTDVLAIENIIQQAYHKYVAIMPKEPAPLLENYSEVVQGGSTFIGMQGEEAVAVMVLKEHEEFMLINNLAVAPDYQGKGWGKAMLQLGEVLANKRGKMQTQLYTNEMMADNVSFYQNAGYQISDNRSEDGYSRVYFTKYV